MRGEIEVYKNFNGEKVRIKRLEYSDAHRTLGYFVGPDGSSDAHYSFTKDLVSKWKARVLSSRLNSSQILQSYETVLKRQILYRLVATSFSFQQCDALMKDISPILLHSANIQEHFPRSIMEAGAEYAGFEWTHIYDLHGQEKLQFFLLHLRKNDTTGQLLRASMKYTQLMMGLSTPFFSLDYASFSYLCHDTTWLQHLWQYTSSKNLDVSLTDSIVVSPPFDNDVFIMDILHESKMLTQEECITANKVRISLQLLHLSDIVDGRGKRLLPDVRNGVLHRQSLLNWPKQIMLKKWIPVWQKACGVLQRYVSSRCIGSAIKPRLQKFLWFTNDTQQYLTNGTTVYIRARAKSKTVYVRSRDPLPNMIKCDQYVDIMMTKGRPKPIFVYNINTSIPSTILPPMDPDSYMLQFEYWKSNNNNNNNNKKIIFVSRSSIRLSFHYLSPCFLF